MSGLIDDDLLYRDDGDLEAGEHQRYTSVYQAWQRRPNGKKRLAG